MKELRNPSGKKGRATSLRGKKKRKRKNYHQRKGKVPPGDSIEVELGETMPP